MYTFYYAIYTTNIETTYVKLLKTLTSGRIIIQSTAHHFRLQLHQSNIRQSGDIQSIGHQLVQSAMPHILVNMNKFQSKLSTLACWKSHHFVFILVPIKMMERQCLVSKDKCFCSWSSWYTIKMWMNQAHATHSICFMQKLFIAMIVSI